VPTRLSRRPSRERWWRSFRLIVQSTLRVRILVAMVMKGVAIERRLDYSAISGTQTGDLAPVLITLERLVATKVTRMRAITNRTAATGPSP
jgi:hypothetical protein